MMKQSALFFILLGFVFGDFTDTNVSLVGYKRLHPLVKDFYNSQIWC